MAAADLNAARLRELLHYDADTGVFTNRIKRSRKTVPGAHAGSLVSGYIGIRLDGVLYRAHRLAWLYVTGAWPDNEIDHINGVRHDNRWANLRDVAGDVNSQNQRRARSRNVVGLQGVSPSRGRYVAQIYADGAARNLGRFDTPEDAHEAYLKAKRLLHAGCTI